ncbi:hypothetical protein [Pseudomonas knackmussii]|uniref:hypothetical protein n=1 Tax=Pseudomonas knackmussii TaxID=65741 RepID=UPI001F483722|nr:hypothetical protein [Pseudomonas knackmussii]
MSTSPTPARQAFGDIAPALADYTDQVLFAMSQPDAVDINEILFRPTTQEY